MVCIHVKRDVTSPKSNAAPTPPNNQFSPTNTPKMPNKLTIAFVYDPKAPYLSKGYSESFCADLADEATITAISNALHKLGHDVIHVPGIEPLVQLLAAGEHENWDLVFNYSEGVGGSARESQIPGLLEGYGLVYTFSDAACLAFCADKAKTKVSTASHYIA